MGVDGEEDDDAVDQTSHNLNDIHLSFTTIHFIGFITILLGDRRSYSIFSFFKSISNYRFSIFSE